MYVSKACDLNIFELISQCLLGVALANLRRAFSRCIARSQHLALDKVCECSISGYCIPWSWVQVSDEFVFVL